MIAVKKHLKSKIPDRTHVLQNTKLDVKSNFHRAMFDPSFRGTKVEGITDYIYNYMYVMVGEEGIPMYNNNHNSRSK
jgi:hypothetical protein